MGGSRAHAGIVEVPPLPSSPFRSDFPSAYAPAWHLPPLCGWARIVRDASLLLTLTALFLDSVSRIRFRRVASLFSFSLFICSQWFLGYVFSRFTSSFSPFTRFNAPFTLFLTFYATDSRIAHPML